MSSKTVAYILAGLAVALIVTGFFVPPMGVIDGSVIKAVGEIMGIIAIFFGWDALDKGIDTKITHGQTKVEFNNDNNENENDKDKEE